MQPRFATFGRDQHRWIRQWRSALSRRSEKSPSLPSALRVLDLGDRARLRRAKDGQALIGDPAVHLLVTGLADGWPFRGAPVARDYFRWGLVAGVIAHLDAAAAITGTGYMDSPRHEIAVTMARRLGSGTSQKQNMSDLRFRQLMGATDPETLLRLWRRAVQLAGGKADAAYLADDLFTWLRELDHPGGDPARSVRFHWAYDYYQQPRDNTPATPHTSGSEVAE